MSAPGLRPGAPTGVRRTPYPAEAVPLAVDAEPRGSIFTGRRAWIVEVAAILVLAFAYNTVRAVEHGDAGAPFTNARAILDAEGWLFDRVEVPLNAWLVSVPVVAVVACYYYAVLHYLATPVVFFLSRRRGGWLYWRGYIALVSASGLALLIYALYPVAPPRLMPGLPIVDVLREFSAYGWWGDAASAPRGIGDATNQFAAMPSMHFGWALWCAVQMWRLGGSVWRGVAVLYPSLLALVVLATGNHFLLDVVGGAACVAVGYLIAHAVRRLILVLRQRRAAARSVDVTA